MQFYFMKKYHLKTVAIICFCVAICAALSCSREKSKFKAPNINIITRENVQAVAMADEDHIWISGNHGMIFHSKDGGESWAEQVSGVESLLCGLSFIDEKTGWACGNKGTILNTKDGGVSWNRQSSGLKTHILDITFLDKDHGWAVGAFGAVLHTADGGQHWIKAIEEQDIVYNNLYFVDRQNGWVVGERGSILHTADGGKSWEKQLPESFKRADFEESIDNPVPDLFGVCFTDQNTGWISGLFSTIIHTSDGGKTWNELISSGEDALYSIFVKGSRGWAVGSRGGYFMSRDGGLSWDSMDDAIKSKVWFGRVLFSSSENGWIAGGNGTVLHSSDGGETWDFYSGLSYEFEGFELPEIFEKKVFE